MALDFSQSHTAQASKKREILCALGIMGIWATVAQQFQLDPPEAQLMAQKRITLAMFGNDTNFLDSRLYDGVF